MTTALRILFFPVLVTALFAQSPSSDTIWLDRAGGPSLAAAYGGPNASDFYSEEEGADALLGWGSELVIDEGDVASLETVALYPAHSNTADLRTEIAFDLPYSAPVSVSIYDIVGQPIVTLVDRVLSAGHHVISFDGSKLPAGTYFCKLRTPGISQTQKMHLAN